MTQFDNETILKRLGDSSPGNEQLQAFEGMVHPSWNIGANPNGGYLMALAAQALKQLSPEHPDPLSMTVHYQRPGLSGQTCRIEAQLLRRGSSLSTSRASLLQDGKSRIEVLASFGDLGKSGQPIVTVKAPDVPPPEQCPARSGKAQGVDLPITERLEIRLHPDEALPGAIGKAQVSGWIRFRDGRPPDSHAALLFADAFPPSVFGLLGMVGWVPTIELTVHVRKRPAPGWILGQFRTHDLVDGKMIEDGCLWDSNGDLIVQARQIGMLISKEK